MVSSTRIDRGLPLSLPYQDRENPIQITMFKKTITILDPLGTQEASRKHPGGMYRTETTTSLPSQTSYLYTYIERERERERDREKERDRKRERG